MKFRNNIENCNRIVKEFNTESKRIAMFEVIDGLAPGFDTEATLRDYIAEFDEPFALAKHDKNYLLEQLNEERVLIVVSKLEKIIINNATKMVSDMLTKPGLPSDVKAYVNYCYDVQRAVNQMANENQDLFCDLYEINLEHMANISDVGYYTALAAYSFTCDEKQDDYNNLVNALMKLQIR